LDVGIFMEFPRPKGATDAQVFDRAFKIIDLAESSGLHSVWLAELHFEPEQSVLSSPVVVAAAAASRTQRLRIGLAVAVLPLYNPLRLAEDVATLDHIAGGRIDFGVGRSAAPRGYIGMNIPYAESRQRFSECLQVIQKAWTHDTFSHHGQFYHYDDVRVVPRPFQQPHPPIRIATNSPGTYLFSGKAGIPIFLSVRGVRSQLVEHVASYCEAWESAGHPGKPHLSLRIPVYVHEDRRRALEDPKASAMNFYRQLIETVGTPIPSLSDEENRERAERGQRLRSITYDDILKTDLAYGTPDEVTEKLLELKETFNLSCVIAEPNFGRLIPQDKELASLQLFAEKVAPKL